MKNKLRALYVAFAGLIGFDVRFTRKGKAFFVLRDQRAERKMIKKLKAIGSQRSEVRDQRSETK